MLVILGLLKNAYLLRWIKIMIKKIIPIILFVVCFSFCTKGEYLINKNLTQKKKVPDSNLIGFVFNFAPYTERNKDAVVSLPGTVKTFLNEAPFKEKRIKKKEVPIVFNQIYVSWWRLDKKIPSIKRTENEFVVEFTPDSLDDEYEIDFVTKHLAKKPMQFLDKNRKMIKKMHIDELERIKHKGKLKIRVQFDAPFQPKNLGLIPRPLES